MSMGVRDKIRQMADDARIAEDAAKDRREELRQKYETEVSPALEKIFAFFVEMEEHLNYLQPDIRPVYEVPGFGEFRKLRQGNYQIDKGRKTVLDRVPFHFTCESHEILKKDFDDDKKMASAIDRLERAGLRFDNRKRLEGDSQGYGGHVTVQGLIPISIVFKGLVNSARIQLTIRNYYNLDSVKSELEPQQVDDAFLEDLASFILREKNKLLTVELSDEEKAHFKSLVQQEREKNRRERLRALRDQLEAEARQSFA